MLHRTTWVAAPVIALVVLGSGLGWGGYNQSRQRASLAQQVENQYTSSLHNLGSHTVGMEDEIGKSLISGDKAAFQSHLRHIWRLSYAAQTDVGRLPFELMPLHSVQAYLAAVTKDTANWIDTSATGTDPAIHHKLENYYSESKQITKDISEVQSDVIDHNAKWIDAIHQVGHPGNGQADNQIVDGLRTVDSETASFLEPSESLVGTKIKNTDALSNEQAISAARAKTIVAKYFGITDTGSFKVGQPSQHADIPVFVIDGKLPSGTFSAHVSQHGGHVLYFDIDHPETKGSYDFVQSIDDAKAWLTSHGIVNPKIFSQTQYDNIAYLVFVPIFQNQLVLNQNISVQVSLSDGTIIGYDGRAYYNHPVQSVPKRVYSSESLHKKLTSHFQIKSEENVIAMDDAGDYQPAVLFYGVAGKETYRILMNARTGAEMSIEQLTRHT